MRPALLPPDEAAARRAGERLGTSAMARWLKLSVTADDTGLLYRLRFDEAHIGNPAIRALHGGVVAALLEMAATLEIASRTEPAAKLRTISCQTEYLRGTVDEDMTARVRILRLGRRVAFLEAVGWQTTEDEPVARAAVALRVLD
ncbi:PaaI family thioesterase [Parvularcula dongshanensis]|uniref:Uncharacterized protein (TIGR00369 family) n=1 Tax=Parvularcula dongshanensis TaxID=1173995 RepID=A0A840I5D6_9PROT|nr:PaaI family thioesterase [Parvularcula dongshanensis]MBB4660166.1 uncharacterized protein (TIGR00369 family) [Parvularcula dongshanensis]